MQINLDKYTIFLFGIIDEDKGYMSYLFPFQETNIENGLRYLILFHKPNDYYKKILAMFDY